MGWNSANRTEQGGKRTVIGSSGSLDVASGGEIDIESGGALKFGGVQANTQETQANAVSSTAGSTSFVTLTQQGASLLSCTGSTATALCGFRLPAPAAGIEKTLVASAGIDATHDAIVETNASGVTIGYAATNHRLAFDALDEAVVLRGVSATKWIVASNVGSVALSTDFTT
jgi:hypothetical protein